jgi:hypothetical protein
MGKYVAVHTVYETKNKTDFVRRPGTEIEMPDEDAKRLLELGAIKRPGDEDAAEQDVNPQDVQLPARPSNGATKETWQGYLDALEKVTESELGKLDVPKDAKRDELIVIGDTRVAQWNEG